MASRAARATQEWLASLFSIRAAPAFMAAAPNRSPVNSPGKTGRRAWSTMLLREWASRAFPSVQLVEQYRLGPTTAHLVGVTVTPALEAALRVSNWFADGILFAEHETAIVEAKIKPTPSAVSQVQFYADLLPRTPAFVPRLGLPISCIVLFAEDDPSVTSFAQRHGCRVAIYTPSWIADYLQLVQFRNRATSPSEPSAEPLPGSSLPEG